MDLASDWEPRPAIAAAVDLGVDGMVSRPRVLLVDDDEATARAIALLLRIRGFNANYICTGAEALAHVTAAPPEAIIIDLHLADDDIPGFLVVKSILARYPHLAMIAITGWYLRDGQE